MYGAEIYRSETPLPLPRFVAALKRAAEAKGFLVHNPEKMDMARTFTAHGQQVPEGFDVHLIQLCKPEKAAPSLTRNPERAPFIPKFVVAFTRGGATQIRMLRFDPELVAGLVDDADFPASLDQSYDVLVRIIEEAIACG